MKSNDIKNISLNMPYTARRNKLLTDEITPFKFKKVFLTLKTMN